MLKLLKLIRLLKHVNGLLLDRASLPYLVLIQENFQRKELQDYFIAVLDYAKRKKTITAVQQRAIDKLLGKGGK